MEEGRVSEAAVEAVDRPASDEGLAEPPSVEPAAVRTLGDATAPPPEPAPTVGRPTAPAQTGHTVELREAQLRNALAVASETPSSEVLKNWIRYQIGRPDGRGWRQNGFGEAIIEQLERELDRLA